MIATIRRTLAGTAAAVAFAASYSASAAGVFYQSDFDPVEFEGTAVWHVLDKDACLGTDGYFGVNLFDTTGNGCKVALDDLDVTTDDASSLRTWRYGPEGSNPYLVAGIWVDHGKLRGVDTFLIGPLQLVTESQATPSLSADPKYGVQFTSGYFSSAAAFVAYWTAHELTAPLVVRLGGIPAAIENMSEPGAYLWERTWNCGWLFRTYLCAEEPDLYGTAQRADFINGGFRQIPEPGSLALLGGALVAGWFTRRRKAA